MFAIATGVNIPFPELIEEKYTLDEKRLIFNISMEKLKPLINDFIINLCEPLFLFIYNPLLENEEKELRKKNSDSFHSELLYLDGQTKKQICEIIKLYGNLLLNDGLSQFGIASHESGDEIFIKKYKIVDIYSKNIIQYIHLMQKYSIKETNNLITAWDTFSREYPGECSKVIINNQDVYNVVEILKKKGMYRAKIVDD